MFKNFLSGLATTLTDLKNYLVRVRYGATTLFIYTILLHFRLLTSLIPGIDTEALIHEPEVLYDSWLTIGRQGLIISKYLLDDYVHNPDFAAIVTLLLLSASCLLAVFLAEVALNRKGLPGENWMVLLFGMTIVSHPILTEQLYFTLQSNTVTLGFLLLALGLLAAHHWAEERNPLWLLLAIALQIIPYCTYQAMVPLFIAGGAAMTFLRNLRSTKPNYVPRLILSFMGGFGVNQMITMLFFPTSSYLSKQIMWGNQSIGTCLGNIVRHILGVCTGSNIFFFGWFGLSCVFLLILTVWHSFRNKKSPAKIFWTYLLLAAVYASPFYMTILLGTQPVYRAQLVLPLSSGLILFLCFIMLWEESAAFRNPHRVIALLLAAFCVLTIYKEASTSSRLYYTNALREQGDVELSYALRQDIAAFTGDADYSGVIIFLGRRAADSNASCVVGDVMGRSIFDWDTDAEPRYYFSTKRIAGFMNCLGTSYTFPTGDEVARATVLMDTMTCYPAQGSIARCGNAVVVKLSEE